jgi:hypothetical protein
MNKKKKRTAASFSTFERAAKRLRGTPAPDDRDKMTKFQKNMKKKRNQFRFKKVPIVF